MEPLEDGEPNSIEVHVTSAMSRTEVVEEVLRRIQQKNQETERLWGEHLMSQTLFTHFIVQSVV